MTIRELLRQTSLVFEEAGRDTPRLDAEVLLACFLRTDRLTLLKEPERLISSDQNRGFSVWVERRIQGEPVAYIMGEKEFWSLKFEVNPQVLIPRPETETLVEEVIKAAPSGRIEILELGVGSGAITIALASELSAARFTATDVSLPALVVAARNAEVHKVSDRVLFVAGDLFAPLAGRFDIVVSNPPYISEQEFSQLPVGVKDYEPQKALLAGFDGTCFLRRIINEAPRYINPGGLLFMEIGASQKEAVEGFLKEAGYHNIAFHKDYGGNYRVARGNKGD